MQPHPDGMTAHELYLILFGLGLDREDAARLLGVSRRALQNWLAQVHPVPHAIAQAVLDLEDEAQSQVATLVRAATGQGAKTVLQLPHPHRRWPVRWQLMIAARVRRAVPWVRIVHAEPAAPSTGARSGFRQSTQPGPRERVRVGRQ